MRKVVAYYRVSTERQRRSGLGLEAQRTAVQRFALTEGLLVVGEYVEAESGKGADALDRRPKLAAALAAARVAKCPVVVAKLDRLSRDVAFVSDTARFFLSLLDLPVAGAIGRHAGIVLRLNLVKGVDQVFDRHPPHPAESGLGAQRPHLRFG